MLTLGSYPSVQSLLNSWLFQPTGIYLVPRSPGLYHAESADIVSSIPFCLGLPGWKVGADENFPPLLRNTNRPRFSDNRPPRPPRYFEDGRMDPSNCGGGEGRVAVPLVQLPSNNSSSMVITVVTARVVPIVTLLMRLGRTLTSLPLMSPLPT